MTLTEDTMTFLSADGWVVTQRDQMLIVGSRQGYGPVSDQILIWVPQQGYTPEQLRLREDGYLRRFEEQARAGGQKYLLTESMEGFSVEFRRRAFREFGVTLTVPTDFFDAPFKWDRGPAATAASSLRNRGRDNATDRIPQPFTSSRGYTSDDDLLRALLPEFRPFLSGPPVHLVVAPAGFGKSHLFRCLFAQLHKDFITAKNEERRALRPLPLLPEHLAAATAPTLKALVEAFLTTEIARPLRLDSFEWMLTHGYGCFLLDGLDEVIARDPYFFDYLYELLTRPDAPHPPRILICVRDSLLVSNKGLGDFLDYAGHELVARHHLTAWQRPSIALYTSRNLDRAQTWTLMDLLDSNPNLMALAGTPFYCEALTSEVRYGLDPATLDSATTETALLKLAVQRMINREFDKGLLQQSWATIDEIESFVKDIAEENLEGGGKGLPVDDVASFAPYSLSSDLDETEMDQAVQHIQQLPFFTGAIDLGRLSFSQDVVYDYLLGIRATEYFASNPRRFLHLLGIQPFSSDSATLHVIREHIQQAGTLDDLYQTALDAVQDRIAFRNVLQVVLSLPDTEWIVRRLPLERQDLSGLRFADMDLSTLSFRGANLESTNFRRCSLKSSVLADAVVKSTVFEACEGVGTADFGDDPKTVLDAARRHGYLEWDHVRKPVYPHSRRPVQRHDRLGKQSADRATAPRPPSRRMHGTRLQPCTGVGKRVTREPTALSAGRPVTTRISLPISHLLRNLHRKAILTLVRAKGWHDCCQQITGRATVIALKLDAPEQAWQYDSYLGRIASVAKLSISLPDDLVEDLKEAAHGNVSAFVATAVRHELDRQRLSAFVTELEDELGPADEAEVARYTELFARTASAGKRRETES